MLTADLSVTGFVADGETLIVQYDVLNENVSAFDVAIYKSSDGVTADAELGHVRISESSLLEQGTGHELAIDLVFADSQDDYFLLVQLDSADEISEGSEANNNMQFEGGVFIGGGTIHVHGTSAGDNINITPSGSNVTISLNGTPYEYVASEVQDVHVRSHDGWDVLTVDSAFALPVWAFGGDGSDTLVGGGRDDVLDGGANLDYVYGGDGDDLLYGGSGDDYLYGQDGNDTLLGEGGNDSLYGGYGDDHLDGGYGNDFLYGEEGSDTLYGGEGSDYLNAGNGYGADVLAGDAGNDTLIGNDQANTLYGGDGDDLLYGGSGDDYLYGQDGNDTLLGEGGNDSLYGGYGDDHLDGGYGNDFLYGEEGSDTLYGGEGDDYLSGGNEIDALLDGGGQAGDEIADRPIIHDFLGEKIGDKLWRFTGRVTDDVDPVGLTVTFGGVIPEGYDVQVKPDGTFGIAVLFDEYPHGLATAQFTDGEGLDSEYAYFLVIP